MEETAYQIDFSNPLHVYFIGIGGVSMSGLAHILRDKGFTVSGSDRAESEMTDLLQGLGITIHIGHEASQILDASPKVDLVVFTAAVHDDNPEYAAAKEARIPMMSRAELLGQLMKTYEMPVAIAGTHGKTTTTSMVSEILLQADTDPTLMIGGVYHSLGSNIRIGHSAQLVTEACEYTNSFLHFHPKLACILNVEADHMDFFKDLDEIYDSFHNFAKLLPADGALVIGGEIDVLKRITRDVKARILTFGAADTDDYQATDITYNENGNASFTLVRNGHDAEKKPSLAVTLRVPGRHNVLNALAAFALSEQMGIDDETILKGLSAFSGAHRRFEKKGMWRGVTVVDDYAHHPTEIKATLVAASRFPHREIWCVFQPHTYTRTKVFLHAFATALAHADHVVLLPIYAAREQDIYGVSSADLRDEIRRLHGDCVLLENFEKVKNFLSEKCTKDDLLITMGAGDVYKIGEELLA